MDTTQRGCVRLATQGRIYESCNQFYVDVNVEVEIPNPQSYVSWLI
jgi:hypothetical protein